MLSLSSVEKFIQKLLNHLIESSDQQDSDWPNFDRWSSDELKKRNLSIRKSIFSIKKKLNNWYYYWRKYMENLETFFLIT